MLMMPTKTDLTLVNPELEAAFKRGKDKADAEYGKESRAFDRAIWGVTEALNQAGVSNTHSIIANRWHCPLASANDVETILIWAAWMHSLLQAASKSTNTYQYTDVFTSQSTLWHTKDANALAHEMADETVIARRVDTLIYNSIKAKHPDVRRNTSRYNELADSVRVKATEFIKKNQQTRAREVYKTLDDYILREVDKTVVRALEQAEHLRTLCRDVEALVGETETIQAVKSKADNLSAQAYGYKEIFMATRRTLYYVVNPEAAQVYSEFRDHPDADYKGVRIYGAETAHAHLNVGFYIEGDSGFYELIEMCQYIDLRKAG